MTTPKRRRRRIQARIAAAALLPFCAHGPARAAEQDAQAVLERLDISLPSEVSSGRNVAQKLDQLRREPCDQTAIYDLGRDLEAAGYRREAATALVSFFDHCGGSQVTLRHAANILLKLSDYSKTIELANRLIELSPYNDNGYYLRARGYDGLKDYQHAIADYVTGIELFGNKDTIASVSYIGMSDDYAALGRYCEAMRPIEAWVALNPARHDTSQTRAMLASLSQKGNCANEVTGRGEIIATPGNGKTVPVTVLLNGVRGRFMLDTGATFVTMTRSFATSAKLHVRDDDHIQLHTANGIADAVLGRADTVKLGTIEAKNVAIAVQADKDGSYGVGIDGLLGMSFLSRFDVSIADRAVTIRARTSAKKAS
jgi:aspartyl protease family protein